MPPIKIHFRSRNIHRLKVREWKYLFHANKNKKKTGVTIPILDKIDFKDCYKR